MTSPISTTSGRLLGLISHLFLIANMLQVTGGHSFIAQLNAPAQANGTEAVRGVSYSVTVIDTHGTLHDMMISTVSLGTWFATTATTCAGTPTYPNCNFNNAALYDPSATTNGSYCSTGIKSDPLQMVECYRIMPNYNITIGANTPQSPDLSLIASVGLLDNITWDASGQSGMLGLASPFNGASASDPWNSILDDMSVRYAQPRQFTLAFSRDLSNGGYLTFGNSLPPNALPLNSPAVFQTNMLQGTFNGRLNNLYATQAGVSLAKGSSQPYPYVIDSGDFFVRVPPDVAQMINSAWNPPSMPMNDGTGRYSIECTAQPPAAGIVVSNHTFMLNTGDLVWTDPSGCWSTVVASQDGVNVLGVPLLRNVMATFDLDNEIIYWQPGQDETVFTSTAVVSPPMSMSQEPTAASSTVPIASASASRSALSSATAPAEGSITTQGASTQWYGQGPSGSGFAVNGQSTSITTTTTYLVSTSISYVTQLFTQSA